MREERKKIKKKGREGRMEKRRGGKEEKGRGNGGREAKSGKRLASGTVARRSSYKTW